MVALLAQIGRGWPSRPKWYVANLPQNHFSTNMYVNNLPQKGTFLPLWPYWLRLALDGHQDQNGMLQICHKSILQEPSDDLMGPL